MRFARRPVPRHSNNKNEQDHCSLLHFAIDINLFVFFFFSLSRILLRCRTLGSVWKIGNPIVRGNVTQYLWDGEKDPGRRFRKPTTREVAKREVKRKKIKKKKNNIILLRGADERRTRD